MTTMGARQPGSGVPYSTGFHALRKRVVRTRGKARSQQCAHCPGQARVWAQIRGTSGADLQADYMPLCMKCHYRYWTPR